MLFSFLFTSNDKFPIELIFDKPYKSVTPGQAAVFYDGDVVLGGATIDEVFMDDVKRNY